MLGGRCCKRILQISVLNINFKTCHRLNHMERIVWMDLEMTGLDVEKDKILEVSCLVTDKHLNIIAEAPTQCIYQPESVMETMNDWCKVNLKKNGLIDACRQSSTKIEEAETVLLKFLKDNVPERQCPLAGNSIYMDRFFIIKYMPKVNDYLHYRIIDISSIKELCKRWNASVYHNAPKKKLSHRSLSDIKESIEELKHYKTNYFSNKSVLE